MGAVGSRGGSAVKRVLIVNCYFDDSRRPIARTSKIPQAMAPVYLAGAFSRALCDVRLYSELASGPLELANESLLSWPDMLVLTGLTNAFDRMRHITAYVRTRAPRAVVVAGGPAVRALPHLSARCFDYACQGDVEQMRDVVTEAFGSGYAADEMVPRYDLAPWVHWLGYAEASRNCNFRCGFCTLTGEDRPYAAYDLADVRRQILALGRKNHTFFLDNNFYGNNRAVFLARLDLLAGMRRAGELGAWSALVTSDFFVKPDNLTRARASGCELLFCGVESFDPAWLRSFNKLQNTLLPQVEMIRGCLEASVVFSYGLVLDLTTRRVTDVRRELDFLVGTPEITLPSFFTLPVPILGTPYFHSVVASRGLLPGTRLRDMDGLTLVMEPMDSRDEAIALLQDLQGMRGYRARIARHSLAFARRYRSTLGSFQIALALGHGALLVTPDLATALGGRGKKERPRTWVSTTEPLDAVYTPRYRVDARYASYFEPLYVTDAAGEVTDSFLRSGALSQLRAS